MVKKKTNKRTQFDWINILEFAFKHKMSYSDVARWQQVNRVTVWKMAKKLEGPDLSQFSISYRGIHSKHRRKS